MKFKWPAFGLLLAIVITTLMDFNGYTVFSALPLFILTIIFWVLEKLSSRQLGIILPKSKEVGLALVVPVSVVTIAVAVSLAFGVSWSHEGWAKPATNILVSAVAGPIAVLLTEEGFFRGWLWASLKKQLPNDKSVLLVTSLSFAAWHISAVTSGSDYSLPPFQVPIFIVNAFLLGLIWGIMRIRSGSILIPAIYHAVWNALVYELFGFGEKSGSLGISKTILLGPEVGLLGIMLNAFVLVWLWPVEFQSSRIQTK